MLQKRAKNIRCHGQRIFERSESQADLLAVMGVDIYQGDTFALSPQPPYQPEELLPLLGRYGHIAAAGPQRKGQRGPAQDQTGGQHKAETKPLCFDKQAHLLHHNFYNIAVAALNFYQLAQRPRLDQSKNSV